jgi:hypothetical protein
MRIRRTLFPFLLLFTFAVRPAAAAPAIVPNGQQWWNGFAFPTVDGSIFCAARYKGGIAIGGRFSFVGEIEAHNIAWWSGHHWEALGLGADSDVLCLIVNGSDLLAGGSFTHAGGNDAAGAARWDGTGWYPLGEGLAIDGGAYPQSGPRAFAFYQNKLVAAGEFTHSGANAARNAAWFDGAAWHALGAGLNHRVAALAVIGDRLFAGGDFDSAGDQPASGLAAWDGAEWTEAGGGVHGALPGWGPGGRVFTLGVQGYSLVVGGVFTTAGVVAANNIARWDGANWSIFGDGQYRWVEALGVAGDSVLVGGDGNAPFVVWDGTQWTYPADAPSGYTAGFISDAAGLLMFGDMSALDPVSGSPRGFKLLRRSGTHWLGFETWSDRMHGVGPNYGGVWSLAHSPNGIYAGGNFAFAANPPQWKRASGLAEWDGTKWTALPDRPATNAVVAILEHEGALFVGGPFYDYSQYPLSRTPVDRLDGDHWTHLDTLSVAVTSLASFQGQLYAAGTRISLSDPNVGGVYRWNGAHWDPIGALTDLSDFPGILAMTQFEGRLIVGGAFNSIGGTAAADVAAWDGTHWEALGTALDNEANVFSVYGLAVHDFALYATGDFSQALGAVARWDGIEWQAVGHVYGTGLALASADSELVATGWGFSDDSFTSEVLAWNGSSWRSLDSRVNDTVRALLVDRGHLYLGGQFTQAGGHPSTGIARWDAAGSNGPVAGIALSPGLPNPFRSATSFAYQLPAAGAIALAVHDVRGRLIATLASGDHAAGPHTAPWDGRDDHGRQVPAGIYLVRLSGAGENVQSTKVVLLP